MSFVSNLENQLADVYKGAPKLGDNAKKSLVKIWPWLALIFGVLQLWAAWGLWRWGHTVNQFVDYANSLSQAFGGSTIDRVSNLNVFYWLSLIVLVVNGLILLAAYSGLKSRAKKGWNLLFLSTLINVVYGVVSIFNNYGGVGSLIMQLVVSAIVLYFLFQTRDQYGGSKAAASK
jgi:hypothetical protein